MRLSQMEWERLRDEFAGQAMAVLLEWYLRDKEETGSGVQDGILAEQAYAMADAMLAKRGNQ